MTTLAFARNNIASVDSSSTHLSTINTNINHRNITGFCVVLAVFMAALITNLVIAQKIVQIGPFVLPASAFIWALTFPCSDIVAEVYGRVYAHRLVFVGFICFALSMLIFQEAILLPPAPFWPHQDAFETILGTSGRLMFAVLIAYAVAQYIDVTLFHRLKKRTKGRFLWLRNNISTMISQTLVNIIFLSLAFLGTIPMENWWHLFITNLIARYCLAFVDTSIVYAGVYGLYRLYPELKPTKNM